MIRLQDNEDYVDENGRLRSFEERRERERQRKTANDQIAAELARRTERPQTDQQRLLAAQENRVRELKSKLRSCLPSERQGILDRIATFSDAASATKAEIAEGQRLDARSRNKALQLAMEHSEGLKSWRKIFPHASQEAVTLAQEILKSTELSAEDAAQAYWRQLELISDANAAEESRLAEIAAHARLGAEVEEAQANVKRLEAEQQRQIVKGNVNGPPE